MYVRKKAHRPGIHVKVPAQTAGVLSVSLQRLLQALHIFRPVLLAIHDILARPTPPNSAPPEETPYLRTYLPPITPSGLIFLRTFGITGNKQKRLKQKPRISCPTQS